MSSSISNPNPTSTTNVTEQTGGRSVSSQVLPDPPVSVTLVQALPTFRGTGELTSERELAHCDAGFSTRASTGSVLDRTEPSPDSLACNALSRSSTAVFSAPRAGPLPLSTSRCIDRRGIHLADANAVLAVSGAGPPVRSHESVRSAGSALSTPGLVAVNIVRSTSIALFAASRGDTRLNICTSFYTVNVVSRVLVARVSAIASDAIVSEIPQSRPMSIVVNEDGFAIEVISGLEEASDRTHRHWLKKLGEFFVRDVLLDELKYRAVRWPRERIVQGRLQAFPAGYKLMTRVSLDAHNHERRDHLLYHSKHSFRSPEEFGPHLAWLLTGQPRDIDGRSDCECCYCIAEGSGVSRASQRQITAERYRDIHELFAATSRSRQRGGGSHASGGQSPTSRNSRDRSGQRRASSWHVPAKDYTQLSLVNHPAEDVDMA